MEKLNINWFPGHMAKAIRLMKEKLALVDLVIELRDARAINSSINPIIQELFKNKPRIIILNKKDLSDMKVNQEWMAFLKKDPLVKVVLTNLLVDQPKNEIILLINQLLKDKINHQKSRGIPNWQIKVMIIGIPNVGKSRLINNLVKRKVSNVANQPGVTRGIQWVKLAQNIHLLDTPGILWPKLDDPLVAMHLSLIGAIKEQLLPFIDISYYAFNFLAKYYPHILKEHYALIIQWKQDMQTKEMDYYFLQMAKANNVLGFSEQQIIQMMTNFYFAFTKGTIKNISWERPK
ncbi:ribosome biogenesis GTPase YlqF [Spiroplasma endosymbiont of Nephrotoma flavescens]|uniref:ribosome biogenesis GTPase YlqF n=1 Tax=Spiroplasma endosymbiont of Nephrotoma flavescens TaxID=3066302 RepID=UPI00313B32C5